MSSVLPKDAVIAPALPQDYPPDKLKEKADWLRNRIDTSLNDVSKMKNWNQKRAAFIKTTVIILSGTGTILLGLQIPSLDSFFKNAAFVLVALVTLINALEPFFNYRALWVESEIAKSRFHRLKDDFDYYMAGTKQEDLSSEALNQFHERTQEIWVDFGASWQGHRASNRSSS